MKLIAISDLHGNLPVIEENANILIIAGDISPLNIQGNKPKMIKWLKTNFIDWVNSLNVEKVYLIAGNHDWIFENCFNSLIVELHMLSNSKLVYLCNQETEYYDSEGNEKTRPDTVRIDSPIVTIPFIDADWETFPVSPLFYCLDDFDAICSIEAVMNHNLSIMAPITFMSASYDAEQFEKLSQVAGQIVEGTLQIFGVVNKSHDMSGLGHQFYFSL